jgi:DNA polymerase-3 subunit beta
MTSRITEAFQLLLTVVPGRSPRPVLNNVRIEASDKGVDLSGTDSDLGLRYVIPDAAVDEPGVVCIPIAQVAGLLRETADEEVTFSTSGNIGEVFTRDSTCKVLGEDPHTFPAIPFVEGDATLELPVPLLLDGIRKTAFATAKEKTRYALNGVLFNLEGTRLDMVATDGKRLSRATKQVPGAAPAPVYVIVPKKCLDVLERFSTTQGNYRINLQENLVHFRAAPLSLCAKLVEGMFPKYQQVIPQDYTNRITMSIPILASAARRAAIFTSEDTKSIQLVLGAGTMTVRCQSELTGEAVITLPIEYGGPEMTFALNPEFLVEALRAMPGEVFSFEFGAVDQPVILRSGEEYLNLIMPITPTR